MWLSVMTRWPSSRSVRARQSPRIVERMWPTCIGLATFGELKSMTIVARAAGLILSSVSPGTRGTPCHYQLFQKTNVRRCAAASSVWVSTECLSRKFRKPAPAISTFSHQSPNVELGQHVGGELARIHFPRLGERHERVALVIAEFGIGTRTDQNDGGVRVRQDRADGGLELQFNLFVRQHGNNLRSTRPS